MNKGTLYGYGICSCIGFLTFLVSALPAGAAAPDQPEAWVDRDHFPEAYGILTSDRVMFPDNYHDWPLKIDATRQLFVDDYLISEIEHLTRRFHQPARYAGNPLMPGGYVSVLYDEGGGRFRMWDGRGSHYTSSDGVRWTQDEPGVRGNLLREEGGQLRGFIYNPDLPEREGRYKTVIERRFNQEANEPGGFYLYHSRDGRNWERRPERPILQRTHNLMRPSEFTPMGAGDVREFQWRNPDRLQSKGVDDTSTFRYDTVLKRYIFDGKFSFYLPRDYAEQQGILLTDPHAIRHGMPQYRLRTFSESEDLIHWSPPRFLMYPDRLDPADGQIYAHVGFVYESMWIGVIQMMWVEVAGWKQTDLHLSYSRNGRHWLRPRRREPFIPKGDADSWEADYHVSAYTAPVRVGEELWFYYSSARNPERDKDLERRWPMHIGLARLRRDGFASLDAGETPGQVVTRPLTFEGKRLFLNADVSEGGWVKAAVLSRDSEPIDGYTLEDAVAITGETTRGRMVWKSRQVLDPPGDDHVRILFELKNARLYSFWIE